MHIENLTERINNIINPIKDNHVFQLFLNFGKIDSCIYLFLRKFVCNVFSKKM